MPFYLRDPIDKGRSNRYCDATTGDIISGEQCIWQDIGQFSDGLLGPFDKIIDFGRYKTFYRDEKEHFVTAWEPTPSAIIHRQMDVLGLSAAERANVARAYQQLNDEALPAPGAPDTVEGLWPTQAERDEIDHRLNEMMSLLSRAFKAFKKPPPALRELEVKAFRTDEWQKPAKTRKPD